MTWRAKEEAQLWRVKEKMEGLRLMGRGAVGIWKVETTQILDEVHKLERTFRFCREASKTIDEEVWKRVEDLGFVAEKRSREQEVKEQDDALERLRLICDALEQIEKDWEDFEELVER